MSKATKKVLIMFQRAMLAEMDAIAAAEHRNRSDLIREAVRRYLQQAPKPSHYEHEKV